jgi:hypothetical protein
VNARHAVMALAALFAAAAFAEPGYTGYSGAPGSSGSCAGTCHGGSGGTIAVTGFPLAYEVGQQYLVSVVKRGGATISNYNVSVRVGSGSTQAGAITAGYLTQTYSTGGEPNGVHLAGSDDDSSTFTWQAPDTSVGDVKLYLAGHQGGMNGANTELVLIASQATGVNEGRAARRQDPALSVEPSVATAGIAIRFSLPADARASLRVIDHSGRLVHCFAAPQPGTTQAVFWQPCGADGSRLASGTYFVVLTCGGRRMARKLVIR